MSKTKEEVRKELDVINNEVREIMMSKMYELKEEQEKEKNGEKFERKEVIELSKKMDKSFKRLLDSYIKDRKIVDYSHELYFTTNQDNTKLMPTLVVSVVTKDSKKLSEELYKKD